MAKVIEPIAHLSLRIVRHCLKSSSIILSSANKPANWQISPFSSTANTAHSVRWMCSSPLTNYTKEKEKDTTTKKAPKKTPASKPKKIVDPEKLKRAQTVKQYHKINKELFGELLETSTQKAKRIKKETNPKKTKKKLVAVSEPPLRDDDYYLNPILDDGHVVPEQDEKLEKHHQIISIPFPRSSSRYSSPKTSDDIDDDIKSDHHPAVNSIPRLPSVSKILSSTMPKEQAAALERWQAKMISQLGEEGFLAYKENMLNNGKMLHSNIETFLRGTPMKEIVVPESIAGHWKSLTNILPLVEKVLVLESSVVHPIHKYCGIVDCVALFENKLVVIDWKTSIKQKPFVSMTYDTPLQIASYIGAINYDQNYSLPKITEGLIAIAYEDGKPGHTFALKPGDVDQYWDKWLLRLKAFYALQETDNNDSR